jgi:hypothetical protein
MPTACDTQTSDDGTEWQMTYNFKTGNDILQSVAAADKIWKKKKISSPVPTGASFLLRTD